MRSIMLWAVALSILGGFLNSSTVSHSLADEPAAANTRAISEGTESQEAIGGAAAPSREAGDVQERGVIRNFDPGRFTVAPSVLPVPGPPATTVPNRGEVGPLTGVNTLPDRYQAPTANLTAVANSLRLQSASLLTALVLPPGLPLTAPVDMMVQYLSQASPREEITQTYVKETGMRLVRHDGLGDGRPRTLFINITLTERPLSGSPVPFVLNWQVALDPLFNVEIGSLRVKLLDDCDWFGKSEVRIGWIKPDKSVGQDSFNRRKGDLITIPQFAWSGRAVSASAQRIKPDALFQDSDIICALDCLFGLFRSPGRDQPPLIPGQSEAKPTIKYDDGKYDCRAEFTYPISYAPYQDPVVSQRPTTIIVDNRAVTVQRVGTWTRPASPTTGWYEFDHEVSSATPAGNRFRWIPNIPAGGQYNVYVWWPNNSTRSTTVPYTAHHADGDTTITFNQRTGGNKWVLHGRYNVRAGTSAYVEVSNANGAAGADAVKFELVGPATFNQRLNKLGKQPNEYLPLNPKTLSPGKIFHRGVEGERQPLSEKEGQ